MTTPARPVRSARSMVRPSEKAQRAVASAVAPAPASPRARAKVPEPAPAGSALTWANPWAWRCSWAVCAMARTDTPDGCNCSSLAVTGDGVGPSNTSAMASTSPSADWAWAHIGAVARTSSAARRAHVGTPESEGAGTMTNLREQRVAQSRSRGSRRGTCPLGGRQYGRLADGPPGGARRRARAQGPTGRVTSGSARASSTRAQSSSSWSGFRKLSTMPHSIDARRTSGLAMSAE